ncbi:cyclin-D3-1-like [Impatiens glandulifera]|uniref:cyclin-D3-1-like n=1 Tax=Impatiens glandulifera TaxID=253017 RepID=UPI001FB06583|nr:cyclin-D3-1-like [Impatiens glandulifera]
MMVSHLPDLQSKNSMFSLYCEERLVDEKEEQDAGKGIRPFHDGGRKKKPELFVFGHDLHWETDELESLMSRERDVHLGVTDLSSDESIMEARREAVEWIMRVSSHYSFASLTILLAVMYYDRFILSVKFQRDMPWMNHLTAVACLSLAAKMEEPRVPLLLDLQVEEFKYVFEAKTVQRMELLVLSSLKWKMNLVTPITFIEHIVRRLRWKSLLNRHFFDSCETLIVSLIFDSWSVSYLPSVMASAVMLQVAKEVDPLRVLDFEKEIMDILKTNKGKVDDCGKLIRVPLSLNLRKRKYNPIPSSPSCVITSCFSSNDSSNDSWTVASSETTTMKKNRADEEMK